MKPVNFKDTSDYQYMEVFGVEGVFSNLRIQRESLPKGFHKYALREGEDMLCCQVAEEILVNHSGDFITKEPLDLGPDKARTLSEDDWGFTDKKFDFEDFFGVKRSLSCQIADATAIRDAQMEGAAPTMDKGLSNDTIAKANP